MKKPWIGLISPGDIYVWHLLFQKSEIIKKKNIPAKLDSLNKYMGTVKCSTYLKYGDRFH